MAGKFLLKKELPVERMPWGQVTWLTGPKQVDARKLTSMEVRLNPGTGHGFHFHPNQEELIYVLEGRIEQWLEQEKEILTAGDCVFIPQGMVHASYNIFQEPARVLPVLGPCAGEGYEVVEVFTQAPWNRLKEPPRG